MACKPLSSCISWTALVDALGIPVNSTSLPTAAECPVCHDKALQATEDRPLQAYWAYCRSCDFAGDFLELAATFWGISLEAAVARLGIRNDDPNTTISQVTRRHVVEYVKPRKDAEQLALVTADGRSMLAFQSPCVLDSFGGIVKPFGDVESCFTPNSVQITANTGRVRNPSARRIFKGAGWGPVSVVPFWDLPGRISGYCFAGRKKDPERDFAFRRVRNEYRARGTKDVFREFGLAIHKSQLLKSDAVIAVRDMSLLLSLHNQHARVSGIALPMVGWYSGPAGRTDLAWQLLSGRDVVIYDEHMSFDVLRALIRTDGKFCRAFSLDGLSARSACERIVAAAVGWRSAVSRWVENTDNKSLTEMAAFLQANPSVLLPMLAGLTRTARTRFAALLPEPKPETLFEFQGRKVAATPDGVFVSSGNSRTRISSARLVVNTVIGVTGAADNEVFYEGRILAGDYEIPFTEPARTLEKNIFQWMQSKLVGAGAPVLLFDSRWSKKFLQMSLQLQPPETRRVSACPGWNRDSSAFEFANASIRLSGVVDTKSNANHFGIQLPSVGLGNLDDHEVLVLRASTDDALCGLAGLFAQIVAPAVGAATPQIAVSAGCGFPELVRGLGGALASGKALKAVQTLLDSPQSRWPFVLQCDATTAAVRARLGLMRDNLPATWVLPEETALSRALFSGALFIEGDGFKKLASVAPTLLGAWLRSAAARQFRFDEAPAFAVAIYRDVLAWLQSTFGVAHSTTTAAEPVSLFYRLIAAAMRAGRRVHSVVDNDVVLIHADVLEDFCLNNSLGAWNETTVTQIVGEQQALLEERDSGWFVESRWLSEGLRAANTEAAHKRLRVVG